MRAIGPFSHASSHIMHEYGYYVTSVRAVFLIMNSVVEAIALYMIGCMYFQKLIAHTIQTKNYSKCDATTHALRSQCKNVNDIQSQLLYSSSYSIVLYANGLYGQ